MTRRGGSRARRLLLWAAATDDTFSVVQRGERSQLEGKCIHCNRKLVVGLDGDCPTGATLEHIVPQHHGGDDLIENLAVACGRCNSGKGRRLDHLHRSDPRLVAVIETLQQRRQARLRDPLTSLNLPPVDL